MSRYVRPAGALLALGLLAATAAGAAHAQGGGRRGGRQEPGLSAPIRDVRYEVTYDSLAARRQRVGVVMRFTVAGGKDPVLLSLPSWTPGAYEISDYARNVGGFTAVAAGRELDWDKVDYDTWRIQPAGARDIEVRFDYTGSTLDNAMTWMRPDFAFFNGTNLFLYPEGRPLDFASTVTVRTASTWRVATGMPRAAGATDGRTFGAPGYHELVDHPFFVGRFDVDSVSVNGVWARLATYPQKALAGSARHELNAQIARMIPAEAAVFGEVPFADYTTLAVFDEDFGGGSALEHASSHLGIYNPQFIGNPVLPSITGHEIFHAWNVKRLRPAEMVPYRYDVPQETTLLWVSEGITDYYADLALVRGGVVPEMMFYQLTAGKIDEVAAAPPVALEDASLTTWIKPTDGTASLYYPKGSLAGFLLDVVIRDASDNRRGLDDVMRELYRATYKQGKGFTTEQFWMAASRAANGKSLVDFASRYVDGREPFPYESILPLAGMRLVADTTRVPYLGVYTAPDSAGIRVTQLELDGAAADAGVEEGDYLVQIGDIQVADAAFASRFRQKYSAQKGRPLTIVVRRGERSVTLKTAVKLTERISRSLAPDPKASAKAIRIRTGILKGTVEGATPAGGR